MKFGIFLELEHPRPWSEGSEQRLVNKTIRIGHDDSPDVETIAIRDKYKQGEVVLGTVER